MSFTWNEKGNFGQWRNRDKTFTIVANGSIWRPRASVLDRHPGTKNVRVRVTYDSASKRFLADPLTTGSKKRFLSPSTLVYYYEQVVETPVVGLDLAAPGRRDYTPSSDTQTLFRESIALQRKSVEVYERIAASLEKVAHLLLTQYGDVAPVTQNRTNETV